jgi:hypothetical protein
MVTVKVTGDLFQQRILKEYEQPIPNPESESRLKGFSFPHKISESRYLSVTPDTSENTHACLVLASVSLEYVHAPIHSFCNMHARKRYNTKSSCFSLNTCTDPQTNMLNTHVKAILNREWLFLSQHDTCTHRTNTFTHAKSAPTQSVVIDGTCRTDMFTHAKGTHT